MHANMWINFNLKTTIINNKNKNSYKTTDQFPTCQESQTKENKI